MRTELPAFVERGAAENDSMVPHTFEVTMFCDLVGKFSGPKTFIEGLEDFVPKYYEEIGQHLRPWVAAPPKVIASEGDDAPEPARNEAAVVDGVTASEPLDAGES